MSPLLFARNTALAIAAALVTALGLQPYDFVSKLKDATAALLA